MATEQFTNGASDVLDGAIDNTQTTLDVVDASSFPATGNFRIIIESEIMIVTGVASETFTVIRGQENTTAAIHSDSSVVKHILTAESLLRVMDVQSGTLASIPASGVGRAGRLYLPTDSPIMQWDDGSDWQNIFMGMKLKRPPPVASFTWYNQGSSTAVDEGDGIHMSIPASSTENLRILGMPVTIPYTLDVAFIFDPAPSSNYLSSGIAMHDTISGKCEGTLVLEDASGMKISRDVFSNFTTYGGTGQRRYIGRNSVYFLRLENNGSSFRKHWVSFSGKYWGHVEQTAQNEHLTENVVGWFVNTNNAGVPLEATLVHWDLQM